MNTSVSDQQAGKIVIGRDDAERQFCSLLEAAPDAIVIVNQRGIIVFINSETERMFGYSRNELLGKNLEILVPDRFRTLHPAHRAGYAKAPFTRPIGIGRTLSARRKNGDEFPAEIGISPFHTANGMLIISSIRDVTERTKAEEVIRKLNAELEERVNRRTAALRKANGELHKEIAARHRLEKEILEISEREQQRIGRDLHDDLGQRLAGIAYISQVLAKTLNSQSSPEASQAERITELLNKALALTRSLARGLHPVALKSGGLMAALGDLARRTSETFQVICRFNGPAAELVLDQTAATHLYRIAREAVTNAITHGKATTIRITFSFLKNRAVLSVADNGSGMPAPDPHSKGMGLRIMDYRANVIGGSLGISRPRNGKGTVVVCTVPEAGNSIGLPEP